MGKNHLSSVLGALNPCRGWKKTSTSLKKLMFMTGTANRSTAGTAQHEDRSARPESGVSSLCTHDTTSCQPSPTLSGHVDGSSATS